MKRTLITFALLTSSVLASDVIDSGLQETRLKMRESITSIRSLQSSQRMDDIQKMKLRNLNSSIIKNYKEMELLAISSAEEVLDSNFAIKLEKHPRIQGSFVLKKNPKMNDLVTADDSERLKAIKETNQVIERIEAFYGRYDNLSDFDAVIAQDLWFSVGDRSSKMQILMNLKKEMELLPKMKETRDQLAKDLGLRVKSINGEYFWDSELLKAKTGYSSFDEMPVDVLKSMKNDLLKYWDVMGDVVVKFNYYKVIAAEEESFVYQLIYRIENL